MSDLENTGWQDDFSVGFTEIDLHHKKLFLILHKFQEILELPDADYKMQIGKVLKNLSEYAEYHFSEEEKLMTTYQYPDLDKHKAEHRDFIHQVQQGFASLAAGNKEAGNTFADFLVTWLIKHITISDKKWGEYISTTYPESKR
ncbi:bacteriohemerythrin [Treponema lecithinolyticum]